MLFSDNIPSALQEHPSASAFMTVLDTLQSFKTEIIARALRVNNAAILTDKKWLLKKLDELGVSDLPFEYPLQIIQQYLLNADTVFRTIGSKKGVELYCSLLSFGKVTIDDSGFYSKIRALILDSTVYGFITDNNKNDFLYLCDDNDLFKESPMLSITIESKYFNGEYPNEATVIKKYLESTISTQLGFSPNKKVSFTYKSRGDFYYHELLNNYFI